MKHPFNKETLAFIRSVGFDRPARWIHGYIYGTYTQPYLKYFLGILRRFPRLPKSVDGFTASSYRGKVTTLEDAKKLVRVNQEVPIKNLERILRLDEALDIVYRTGDSILLTECVCRLIKEDPCKPLEVCMVVGEPFASFVARQQGERCRWISQEEAVEVLEMTEKLGWPHIVFNRDVVGDNFYAICHCCKCCCGGMILKRQFGIWSAVQESGYRTELVGECTGCGTCQSLCQFEAIRLGAEGTAVIDPLTCKGCGVCVSNCPEGAIVLKECETGLKPLRLPA